ncbi:unnamed protein product [Heligmosomoides polygyrus]|uniref:Rep_fac-A_C domain-containing protein n=1 Tax=Heligmosomoides polygyrus TaxID=6339 RepID=A0A183F2E2_HELPZ|nr:unnamed protein product [Heligmosomoides polygyrus]
MPSRPIATPGRTGIDAPSTVKVQLQPTKPCPRVTCVRDLNKCCLDTVDFLGIIIGTAKPGRNNVPVIKVADRHGESVALYLLSSSVPPNISAGSVISVEGAAMERNQGSISLVLNDSTFVDMEPNDPEAECLRRLFSTGLFDVAPTEGDFTFDNTALRVIGRLNEYSSEPSTVMARICSINYEALLYLGCSTCRRYAARNSDGLESCQNCRSKKARYFYSLNVEIADFSGVIPVHFSDEAAEKMIGKPAGAMVKVPKNQGLTFRLLVVFRGQLDPPQGLTFAHVSKPVGTNLRFHDTTFTTLEVEERLSPLYYRPMLFRVSQQSSRWFIDDWKELEIARFKPFLKTVAEKKGYK